MEDENPVLGIIPTWLLFQISPITFSRKDSSTKHFQNQLRVGYGAQAYSCYAPKVEDGNPWEFETTYNIS